MSALSRAHPPPHAQVHAPPAECEKLEKDLGPLGAQFFKTEWGFRNAV